MRLVSACQKSRRVQGHSQYREGTLLTPSGKQNCTGQEAGEPGRHIRLE